ncbi:DUF4573 domain-containing protein [Ruminobacter sp. RM87]|uniref:DUF4573 domain-containing protein n=1 Tax=Ruminobacter sp. RM87 TaxID=1200567 RepID=UPI0004E1CA39|nr:DUF4573 domain-containing protein [Ruminobacter sp. RM87]
MDKKLLVLTGAFLLVGCSVTSSSSQQKIDIKMAKDKYEQSLANHIEVVVDDNVKFVGQRSINVRRTKTELKVKYGSLPGDNPQCIVTDTMVIQQHDKQKKGLLQPANAIVKTGAAAVDTTSRFLISTPSSSMTGSATQFSSTSSEVSSAEDTNWFYGYDHNEYMYSPRIVDSDECREWIKPYLKDGTSLDASVDLISPETVRDLNFADPAEQIKQFDPTEQIRQLDPTEQIRQLDPTEQIKQLDPTEQIRQFDPAEQIRQLDPTEQIKQLDPSEQIKQLDPAEQIKQLNPTEQIRQLDPAEQIKTINPVNQINTINPAGQIKKINPDDLNTAADPADGIRVINRR